MTDDRDGSVGADVHRGRCLRGWERGQFAAGDPVIQHDTGIAAIRQNDRRIVGRERELREDVAEDAGLRREEPAEYALRSAGEREHLVQCRQVDDRE